MAAGEGRVHETDEALLTRLRAGDASAFEAVVWKYQRDLYRLAYRFTRNMEDAKDLAQEAFLRAYRALPRFDGRSSVYTWLYRITLNLCLNHRRGRTPEGTAEAAGVADPAPGALEALAGAEREAAVAAAIASLPPQQRTTVILRVQEGLPHKAIVEILECSERTVKANFFHAIRNLRERLRGYGAEEGCEAVR